MSNDATFSDDAETLGSAVASDPVGSPSGEDTAEQDAAAEREADLLLERIKRDIAIEMALTEKLMRRYGLTV